MKKNFEMYDLICFLGRGIGSMALLVVIASIILLFLMWVNGFFIPALQSIGR